MRRFGRDTRMALAAAALLVSGMAGVLVFAGPASATASLSVSPNTGLSGGSVVTLSGSGFADSGTGGYLECNSAAGQPTIPLAGNNIPVSCSNATAHVITTTSTGDIPAGATFTIIQGTVGPPQPGNDSSGKSGAADAADYPCPPTAAQVTAGATCEMAFGTLGGAQEYAPITFATPSTPTTAPTAPSAVSATASDGAASVSFTAPSSDGHSPITSYTVTATDATTSANGGETGTGSSSPISVTGLTDGDSYTFTVAAINSVGTGTASSPSTAVTPTAGVQPTTTTTAAPTTTTTAAPTTTSTTVPCDAKPASVTGPPSVTVTPGTCLNGGTVVTVTGSGFTAGALGNLLECNSDAGQPTVALPAPVSQDVPVSCTGISTAAGSLITVAADGTFSATFTIVAGTTGPPCGPNYLVSTCPTADSSGGNPTTDAAAYPCPPTTAQAATDNCTLSFGDSNSNDKSVSVPIAFVPAPTPGSGATTTTTTAAAAAATAAQTAAAAKAATAASTLAFTGAGPDTWYTLLGGLLLLDLGFLILTLYYRPREMVQLVSRGVHKTFGGK
jgi:Fibronectin type III domain